MLLLLQCVKTNYNDHQSHIIQNCLQTDTFLLWMFFLCFYQIISTVKSFFTKVAIKIYWWWHYWFLIFPPVTLINLSPFIFKCNQQLYWRTVMKEEKKQVLQWDSITWMTRSGGVGIPGATKFLIIVYFLFRDFEAWTRYNFFL